MTNEEWKCPNGHIRIRVGCVEPEKVGDMLDRHTLDQCYICGAKLVQGKYTEKKEDAWTTNKS